MPLPTPNSGESEDDLLSRCMGDSKTADEFPDESQRYAVCIAQIDNYKAISDREDKAEFVKGMMKLMYNH